MQPGALHPYEEALFTRSPLSLVTSDGRTIDLDVSRWLAAVDGADETVLARCVGPVLDVGCGPGRFVRALAQRDQPVLGVDIAGGPVRRAERDGLPVLLRSVFDALPDEGLWSTVLLLDGNVGIGGDPVALLERAADLLEPGGRLIVEVWTDHALADGPTSVRFASRGRTVGPVFGWAFVGTSALLAYARRTGYSLDEVWSSGGRGFVALTASRAVRAA